MTHKIVVIFDASDQEDIDDSFQFLQFDENYRIYYLKLDAKQQNNADTLYTVMPASGTPLEIQYDEYSFRDVPSLKKAIEYIKFDGADESKYYLISIGHGAGYGFFKRSRVNLTDDEIAGDNDCGIVSTVVPDFDILWTSQFVEAIKSVEFDLAIFNQCDVSMFENCVLFSECIKYIIATENFLSQDMLKVKCMLNLLFNFIPEGDTAEHLGGKGFDRYIQMILQVEIFNSVNVENASLFFINLLNFREHFLTFEKIVEALIQVPYNLEIIRCLRSQQPSVSPRLATIDMREFFINIAGSESIPNEEIKKEINDFLSIIDQQFISKWSHRNKPALNGMCLYFPKIESFEYKDIYIFNRNFMCSEKKLKPSNWDKLLDKIKAGEIED